MANENNQETDYDKMSDEDFLKLSEPEEEPVQEVEEVSNEEPAPENPEEAVQEQSANSDDAPSGDPEYHDSGDDPISSNGEEEGTPQEESSLEDSVEGAADPHAGEGQETTPESSVEERGKQSEADPKEEGKKASEPKAEGQLSVEQTAEAVAFFQKITAPFKADGKDFTVRSAEDAIRLMQQGVNYSRRMAELKPIKAIHRTLTDNGLADQNKLNLAIDLIKGDKGAITQLLKSHNIDPMDLDTEKDSGYQANNYAGNAQDNAFRDALDEAVSNPDGQALVTHIQADWDVQSKAKLRENPAILGDLQELKASGVYDKVVEELRYQQSIGYLKDVPFLQAFDQVGEAMKNAGVFAAPQTTQPTGGSMAPLQAVQPQSQPVASGARKAPVTKKPVPNPHLSSTPPSKQNGNSQSPVPINFDKMSDEDFLKLSPPE